LFSGVERPRRRSSQAIARHSTHIVLPSIFMTRFTFRLSVAKAISACRHRGGMETDDVLTNLAWGLIRDWRRRRDVDPAIRREWVRLYVGVIRQSRRGRAVYLP